MRLWDWPVVLLGSIGGVVLLLLAIKVPFWVHSRLQRRRRREWLVGQQRTIHPDEVERTLSTVSRFIQTPSLGGVEELWVFFSDRNARVEVDWDRRMFKDAKLAVPSPTKEQLQRFGQHLPISVEVLACSKEFLLPGQK